MKTSAIVLIVLTTIILFTACSTTKKNKAEKANLHNVWTLTKIEGKDIDKTLFNKIPTLDINMTNSKISGSDGCNNFNGLIKKVSDETLILGPLASTRKFCENMKSSTQYASLLTKVAGYKQKNNNLHLRDKEGNTILSYKKVN